MNLLLALFLLLEAVFEGLRTGGHYLASELVEVVYLAGITILAFALINWKYIFKYPDLPSWELNCIDEIALVNPRNSTEEVCEEFILRYHNHKAGLFYYGDASGHSRTVGIVKKDFQHHYEIIEYKLRKYLVNDSDRSLRQNPSVVLRRDFINKMFEGKLPIKITIDENCHYTISDFMYLKQALDGTKDKSIVTDKETGDKYQKYGHLSDTFDYLAVELFKQFYNG